jgi:carbonic anhydrase/acetyltransferase-like protein (isoleucine patch superfamily)
MPGVYCGNRVKIGSRSVVADHSYLSSVAYVGEDVHIGMASFLGEEAAVFNRAKIGHHAILGAGAQVGPDASLADYTSLLSEQQVGHHTEWSASPPAIRLVHTTAHISRPGFIRSGCVELPFSVCTPIRVREECRKAGYSEEAAGQYVAAIRWLIDGWESGVTACGRTCGRQLDLPVVTENQIATEEGL